MNTSKVKELRLLAGMTQQQLGDLCHSSRGHICDIERGNNEPKVRLAIRISKALKKPVGEIWPQ